MKRIICCFVIPSLMLLASCKKKNEIKETRDLKNLPLSELKSLLNGKWRLHRSERGTIAGRTVEIVPNNMRVYLIFYPVDSIRQENTANGIVIREKLVYEWLRLPWGGEPQYVNTLIFDKDVYDYRNKWVADRLDNDTLVFVNYFKSEGGDNFYYTKEH